VNFRILITFYRFICPLTLAVTAYNAVALFIHGAITSAVLLIWSKVITSVIIGACFWFIKKDQFYFFQNLGYTWRRLLVFAFLLDMSIWLASVIIVYIARYLYYII